MTDQNETIRIKEDDARAGHTPGVGRRVLGFGLLLAVSGMSAAWIIPSLWG
jgi:putative heme iron utilization protein